MIQSAQVYSFSDKKTCILVLGMHRSGTSALTGLLEISGISLGSNLVSGGPDNIKGHFENKDFLEMNEAILAACGMGWDSLLFLPVDWKKNPKLIQIQEMIRHKIQIIFENNDIFAVKDPRILKLFPIWEEVLCSLNIEIKIIFSVRNPMETALSLHKRNSMSLEKGLILFVQHILCAEADSRGYERVVVLFDDLVKDTVGSLFQIQKQLKINFPHSIEEKKADIHNFIDARLKHHNEQNVSLPHFALAFDLYSFLGALKFRQITDEDIQKLDGYTCRYNEQYGQLVQAIGRDHDNLLHRYNLMQDQYNELRRDYDEKQSSITNGILIILSRTIGRVPFIGNMVRSLWQRVKK